MKINYLFIYQPYHKGKNKAFNHISGMLLSFKKGEDKSIQFWLGRIERELINQLQTKAFYIATVPSSTKGNKHLGFEKLIPKLSGKFDILNEKRNLIKRDKTIEKLANGGSRAIGVHINSLSVRTTEVAGKNVVLIDDVTTSGNSMRAAISKLERAGYNVIFAMALGKTA